MVFQSAEKKGYPVDLWIAVNGLFEGFPFSFFFLREQTELWIVHVFWNYLS